ISFGFASYRVAFEPHRTDRIFQVLLDSLQFLTQPLPKLPIVPPTLHAKRTGTNKTLRIQRSILLNIRCISLYCIVEDIAVVFEEGVYILPTVIYVHISKHFILSVPPSSH